METESGKSRGDNLFDTAMSCKVTPIHLQQHLVAIEIWAIISKYQLVFFMFDPKTVHSLLVVWLIVSCGT